MLIPKVHMRPALALTSAQIKMENVKVVLFVALIVGLILWAFWGQQVQQNVYDQNMLTSLETDYFGAEIVLSQFGNGSSDIIVGRIYPNSPADRAGLKVGDQIIGIDGRIISNLDTAVNIINSHQKGSVLKVTVQRQGWHKDIYVHISPPPPRNHLLKVKNLSFSQKVLVSIVFLKLAILMFFLVYNNILNRTAIVLFFAASTVILGTFFRIYSPMDAFFSIKFNTISLLLGMGLVSVILDQTGFFDSVAYKIYRFAGHSRLKIFTLFCLMTYIFSLLVNNLTTIIVMVPMTLSLAAIVGFDPRPLIIGEIIASNLGGASTMVGDFPNMLISSEALIGFNQFIIFMMPICMILFSILLFYLNFKFDDFDQGLITTKKPVKITKPKIAPKDRRAARRAVFILCHMVFLFTISQKISLNPSAIALFGGLSLFLFSGLNKGRIISRIGFNDLLFFVGLFIVVGSLEASGILEYVSMGIKALSFGKPWLLCLTLMWSAAFLTAFLSAGPTTALFFPIVLGLGILPPHHMIWWSLSLGVLAGSSATIVGATAGPVATTLVEQFSSKYSLQLTGGNTIPTGQFARIGIPIMFIFLVVSSIYIIGLSLVFYS